MLFVTLIEVKFFSYKYWHSPLFTVESNMNLSDPVTDLIKKYSVVGGNERRPKDDAFSFPSEARSWRVQFFRSAVYMLFNKVYSSIARRFDQSCSYSILQ